MRIEFPWELEIGKHVAIGPRTHLYNLGGLSIGDNTVLSQDVYVCGGTHDYTDPALPLLTPPVQVGTDAWICARAFIGPGVTVGAGAIVAACGVAVKDVEPWTIVGGNPVKSNDKRRISVRASAAGAGVNPICACFAATNASTGVAIHA